jgi:NAD-dependent SIR2 family protein deacetylase
MQCWTSHLLKILYFRHSPEPFCKWAQEFFPGVNYRPTIGHHFINLLNTKGKLLRLFTQNIDGLEKVAGLPEEKIVAAHGGFSTASCISCSQDVSIELVKKTILDDLQVPFCSSCGGFVKPDIVFFGENLPDQFWTFQESDTADTDLLICIGTSLEVYPFAGLADQVGQNVPRILMNREIVGSFGSRNQDVVLQGDLVPILEELRQKLN